jgi:hypothetical protein
MGLSQAVLRVLARGLNSELARLPVFRISSDTPQAGSFMRTLDAPKCFDLPIKGFRYLVFFDYMPTLTIASGRKMSTISEPEESYVWSSYVAGTEENGKRPAAIVS